MLALQSAVAGSVIPRFANHSGLFSVFFLFLYKNKILFDLLFEVLGDVSFLEISIWVRLVERRGRGRHMLLLLIARLDFLSEGRSVIKFQSRTLIGYVGRGADV